MPRVCLMGVAGAGKTTVGSALARRLDLPFVDADDLHDAATKARLARGVPLDDRERRPWLTRVNHRLRELARGGGFVLACSALTEQARHRLADGVGELRFVLLQAPAPVLSERLRDRAGHFAGPELLPSQLDTLEVPADAPVVDSAASVAVTVDRVCAVLGQAPASAGRSSRSQKSKKPSWSRPIWWK